MNYTSKIEVYRVINENFITPLKTAPESKKALYYEGDLVIIMDGCVWIKDRNNGADEFSLAVYGPEFVRINPTLFEKVDRTLITQ